MSEQIQSKAFGTAASSRSVLAHSGFGEPEATLAPLDLRAALAVLRRHLWIVAGVTGVCVAVAAYLGFMTPPTYRATAVVRLASAREALTTGLVDGPSYNQWGQSADPLLSQIEVLKSRAVAGAVVDSMPVLRIITPGFPSTFLGDVRFTSSAVPDSLELLFQGDDVVIRGENGQARVAYGTPVEIEGLQLTVLGKPLGKRGKLRVIDRDSAVSALLGRLRVTPRQKTDVIDVSYAAHDPQRARQVVNSVVAVFQAANAHAAQQQARLQRQFIEAQLQRTDSVLAAARGALSAFRRQHGIERTEQAGPASSQGDGGQFLIRREESDAERRVLHGLLGRLRDKGVGQRREALRAVVSLPGVAVNLEVAGLYAQLVRYETTLDSLRSGRWAIAGTHPDVERLNELVTSVEARLVPAVQNAVQSRIASLDASIATLDAVRARKASTFERLSAAEGEEARLAEQVGNASKIADQLRTEQQKARIAEAVQVGQVEILDLAPLPATPIGVGVMRMLTFGLLLGLLLGGTGAFVADHLNRSISRPKDVMQLGLPVLGVVPHVARARNGAGTEKAMPVVEALRGIRFNLVHAYGAAGPLLVTITSPGSREGKSFIGSNLALAFAEANQRTILIDADVRRGGLHRLLQARRKPGLTDLLKGDASREEVVQSTAYPSLSFVGCGTRSADAPELLCSPAMSQLVTGLRSLYGVIIIDSPPLGAGVDAFALGTITANILMVLRVGATDREVAEVKLDLLQRLPVRTLGVVLNDVRDGSLYQPYAYYMAGYEAENEKRTGRGRRVLGRE